MNVAKTLHPTLFQAKHLLLRYLQNVEYASTLHSPYIHLTQIETPMNFEMKKSVIAETINETMKKIMYG